MFRQGDGNAGADQHYHHLAANPSSSPFTTPQFATPVYGLEAQIPGNPQQHLQPGSRSTIPRQISHARQSSVETQGTMQPPPNASPRMPNVTSAPLSQSVYRQQNRTLPSRDVNANTIADAFVSFILYCNPSFSLEVDSTALKSTFLNPPKTDSKDFETFRLFELLKKFDAKEIKTWNQLALDLGVEAPDLSKGQSSQKVQQYTVRLKRWMRAMHIDAFFEYLLGKQHAYYMDVPPAHDPFPSNGRDGVPAEEDLAIRALDPSFRPKRGRRRNSDADQDENISSTPATRQPSTGFPSQQAPQAPMSAIPMSAQMDGFHDPWAVASAVTPQSMAPWAQRSAAPHSSVAGPGHSHLRWQLDPDSQTPHTPHPLTAIPASMTSQLEAAFEGEPKSAVTPSSRKRKRHGPAVSSAWPSANAPGAKPRGRPPANRNTQDGPFGTFPVDPSNDRSNPQVPPNSSQAPSQTPVEKPPSSAQASTPVALTPTFSAHNESATRLRGLSLQVPPHTGAPVRLATPPRVLLNGEDESQDYSNQPGQQGGQQSSMKPPHPGGTFRVIGGEVTHIPAYEHPGFAFEALKRVIASDLLRATLIGRDQRLTGEEAKRLADSMLNRFGVPRNDTSNFRDDIARLTAASWFGVGGQLHVPLGPATGHGKRITVTRFRMDADGYDEPVPSEDNGAGSNIRQVFDITWQVSLGSCMGNFELKGLTLADPGSSPAPESTYELIIRKGIEAAHSITKDGWVDQSMHEVARSTGSHSTAIAEDETDWKARCKAMELSARLAEGQVANFRQRTLEKIIDILI